MHTVIETAPYLRAAANLTEKEREEIVSKLANDPEAGELIVGTGGCRKLRFAGRSKGKNGGYRIITFFSGRDVPVFLLTVFSKGERANLSKDERNALGRMTATLVDSLERKVVKIGRRS